MKIIQMSVGGINKNQLFASLEEHQIALNPLAHQLLEQLENVKLQAVQAIEWVEVTVGELGLKQGGTLLEIFAAANSNGLRLCETEMAPLLSLHYPYSKNSTGLISTGKVPETAVTIASNILQDSDNFPKGFYLRKIDGTHWLRGYLCDHLHVFDPMDGFIFLSERT